MMTHRQKQPRTALGIYGKAVSHRKLLLTLALVALIVCIASPLLLHADEGMWTFNNFPSRKVGQKYGFVPSQQWLNHIQLSSLRIAEGCSLSLARRQLGVGDPLVVKMLGKESPEERAQRMVAGTHLGDAKVREDLYKGGKSAIDASTDPLIVFARTIEPELLAFRKKYDAEVDAPTRAAAERIAKARFAIYGTSVYPDATFTPRLSYGTVKGFTDARGNQVKPYTDIAGLFDRATGAPPFNLPESWLKAKPGLNLSTPMNLSTTNDIIGGNSGSPLINKDGEIVGLIFDGNIYSIGGDYGYEAAKNRAVAVDSRALLEGLSKVYHLTRIVSEISSAR